MTHRKISKSNLKKCKGLNATACGICKRQDDTCSISLVMGIAHGKCIHYIT